MTSKMDTRFWFREGFTPKDVQVQMMEWWDSVRGNRTKCKKVNAPTATGKSLFNDAVTKCEVYKGKRVAIITGSNLLLNQYIRELPEYPSLMGAANYNCVCFPGNTCDMTRQMAKLMGMKANEMCGDVCPYAQAKDACLRSNYAIFNPLSYFYFPKYQKVSETGTKIPLTDLLIVDEFQMLAGLLNAMFELTIWEEDIHIPAGISSSNVMVVELLKERYEALVKYLRENSKKMKPKQIKTLVEHSGRIIEIVRWLQDEPELFVVEELVRPRYGKNQKCLQIRVTKPVPKILRYFFAAKEVLLTSATALDIDVRELGFKHFDSLDVRSPIAPERRQIYVENIAMNTFKNQKTAIPKIVERTKELCETRYKDVRGIILCTYRMSQILKDELTDERYVFHEQKDKKEVIDKFISRTDNNQVAVLCGSWEGLDLKDDLARFVIIPGLPLPNWTDAVVQKRVDQDRMAPVQEYWYEMQAMKSIIQGCGRATRHEQDQSTIHILDSKFNGAYVKTKDQLPSSFTEAIKWGKA